MIVPIPLHEIAFREIASRKIKAKSIPKVSAPAIEVPVQVAVPSTPKATPDVKASNTFNNILAITVILVVVGVTIYLVHKHQEDKREKANIKMY